MRVEIKIVIDIKPSGKKKGSTPPKQTPSNSITNNVIIKQK